ncbi:hypothetical protein [Variovorax rhizosphaerae]|uniref:Uncharacterized protein n=1 Tax=Variovorax rhizosphaerae TaxID=1836200 RepID=A0ABU8WUQ5_9BURK
MDSVVNSAREPPTPEKFARLHEVRRAVFTYLLDTNTPTPADFRALTMFARRLEKANQAARDWSDSLSLRVVLAGATKRDGNPTFQHVGADAALEAMLFLRDMLYLHSDIIAMMARADLPQPIGHQEPALRRLVLALAHQWQGLGGHPGFSSRPTRGAGGARTVFTGPFLNAVVAAIRHGVHALNIPADLVPTHATIASEIRALRHQGRLAAREGD